MSQRTDGISKEARQILHDNVVSVLQKGPGLRYSMGICVLAKNRETRQVLLGGLGGMGVGQAWFIDDDHKKRLPGYLDAPEKPVRSYFNEFSGRWILPR